MNYCIPYPIRIGNGPIIHNGEEFTREIERMNMDTDLSHSAQKEFNEAFGWIGQLDERIKKIEEHLGLEAVPEEEPSEVE